MKPFVAVFPLLLMAIRVDDQQNEEDHPTDRQRDDDGFIPPISDTKLDESEFRLTHLHPVPLKQNGTIDLAGEG